MRIYYYFRFLICFFIILYSSISFGNINKISFSGLNTYSDISILKNIRAFSYKYELDTSDIINIIYNLNLFKFVKLSIVDDLLKIDLIELPTIRSIKVFGIKDKKSIYEVLDDSNICVGGLYNNYSIELFKQNLEKYYNNQGFHKINIDINYAFNNLSNVVDINININTYKKQRIKKIKFVGNKLYSDDILLKLLYHSKTNFISWITNSDVYSKGKLVADLENIRAHYIDKGYVGFHITSTKVFISKNNKYIYLYIFMNEGKRYYTGDINITSDCSSISKEINSILINSIKTGSPFSRKKLMSVQKKIRDYLYNKGYVNSDVDFNILNIGGNAINIEFFVKRGSRALVRKIFFIGNNINEDNVLRRNIPQGEGSWISMHDINFGKDEIIRSGLANNVSVSVRRYKYNDKYIDVFYKLKEQKTTKFVAGFSYSSDDGLYLNVGAELTNFLGTGKDILLNINKTRTITEYSLNYFNQQFSNNKEIGFGYNLYYKSENINDHLGYFFDNFTNTFGGYAYYSFKLGYYTRFNTGFGCDITKIRVDEDEASDEVNNFISNEGADFKEYYYSFSMTYNSLDKVIFPNSGVYHNLIFRYSFPFSNLNYYNFNYNLNCFKEVSEGTILNALIFLNYGDKYSNTYCYPYFKNFYMKGNAKVRGFKDRCLGPRDSNGISFGGNFLVNLRLSLFLPIFNDTDTIRTGLFLDAGQVYYTFVDNCCDDSVFIDELHNKSKSFSPKASEQLKRYESNNNYYEKLFSFSLERDDDEDDDEDFEYIIPFSNKIRFSVGIALTWNTPFGVPIDVSFAYPLNMQEGDTMKMFLLTFGM